MKDEETLIQFPCDFPIKIIGTNSPVFVTEIIEMVIKHFPETTDEKISHKPSEKGNYAAITVVVYVMDKPSLDALYIDLTSHPDIKMVL